MNEDLPRLVRHSVEGTVVFLRSEALERQCACCDGPHIYSRFVKFDDWGSFWQKNEQCTSVDQFILEKVLFPEKCEGMRVRVTVELLSNSQVKEAQPRRAMRTEELEAE